MSTRVPKDAEVLRYIAQHESLGATLEAFPGLEQKHLARLLEQLAETLGDKATLVKPRVDVPPSRPSAAALPRIRVYSDGAARGNPGPAGAGAVLVDPSGKVIDRVGKYLGVQTNNHAEYMGLLIGLRRALELGVQDLEVLADSELMIRQLGGTYKVKSPGLRPLFDEAQSLLRKFPRVKLVHVPREMNAAADAMSNRAIDERL